MTVAQEFARANKAYVSSLADDQKDLPLPPARKAYPPVTVLTCMDARIDPAASLGIKEGEAHVIRNAGGRASEALRSVVISQQLLGTTEVVVFHHTDCGMLTFTDEALRTKLKHAGLPATQLDALAFLPFTDLEQSVKDDVDFLRSHPLVSRTSTITGWVHDVKDGSIRQVV